MATATTTEKKLGPSVTYLNPDKSAKLVTVAGVLMKEGESVNLVERLGEAKAEPVLKKLAGNKYFKVDGGPEHDFEATTIGAPDPETTAGVVAEEARIRARDGDEAADAYVANLDEKGQPKAARGRPGELPAGARHQPPEKETLEQPAQRRPTR